MKYFVRCYEVIKPGEQILTGNNKETATYNRFMIPWYVFCKVVCKRLIIFVFT